MNKFKINIFKTFINDVPVSPILESGAYSSVSEPLPDNSCALIIDTNCWIDTITNGIITSGDIAYTDVDGTIPIIGGNQYYKMSLVNSYVVLIQNDGTISVHTICA